MVATGSATPISGVVVDARATSAILSYATADPVPTLVEYSVEGAGTRIVEDEALATTHAVTLTGLSPGTTVEYVIVAGAATHAGSFVTSTDATFFLHNRGTPAVLSADEFDTSGDVDGRGYNGFGAAAATAEAVTGTSLLGVVDTYPAESGALALAPGAGSARLFVKFSVSGPTVNGVGTTVARGSAAAATFRVSLLAGETVLATGTGDVLVTDPAERWIPVDVALASAGGVVPEGALAIRVVAERATAGFAFGLEGDHASRVSFPTLAGVPSFPIESRKTDFTQGARVVVAVIDSGINPYHPQFRRDGAVLPLGDFVDAGTGLQPRVIDLSDAGDYRHRVDVLDDAAWDSIGKGELVWFKDTNVMAISIRGPEDNEAQSTINNTAAEVTDHRVRDVNGHGTATASTVLSNFPDALVVMIQITTGGGLADATRWAASQPWIDVISTSFGAQANVPSLSLTPRYTRQAFDAGKVVVNSAGNDPSPLPTDHQDGPHWVIAATGSQVEGQAKEVLSANVYPDYVADYTVSAAVMDNVDDVYGDIGGTSFSCPTVAGTIAGIVYKLREAKGHEGGIVARELAPGVTNRDVRAALNKTAIIPAWDGYVAGIHWNGDHMHAPGAEFATIQWGHVDQKVIGPATAAILANDYAIPPEKAAVAAWKGVTWQYRVAYWTAWDVFY